MPSGEAADRDSARGPESQRMIPPVDAAAAGPGRSGPPPVPCDRCGIAMVEHHCKLQCPRCGLTRDCSDP